MKAYNKIQKNCLPMEILSVNQPQTSEEKHKEFIKSLLYFFLKIHAAYKLPGTTLILQTDLTLQLLLTSFPKAARNRKGKC